MKKLIALILAVLMILSLAACGGKNAETVSEAAPEVSSEVTATPTPEAEVQPQEEEAQRTQDIKIIYTNDTHCHVDSNLGFAGVAALKKQLEADGNAVILADSGDVMQGGAYGTLSNGSIPLTIMNELGYSVMVTGNHDYDYGIDVLMENASSVDFPIISMNFIDLETGETLLPPYVILEADGAEIAFIGVTTPETITSSTPTYFMNDDGEYIYGFLQDDTGDTLYSALQDTVDEVRALGVDYVVVLSHMGIDSFTEPFTSGTMIERTSGIDVVLDAHSHSVIDCEKVKNAEGKEVILTQTGTALEYIGVLTIDTDGNLSCGLVDSIEPDEDFAAVVESCKAEADEILNQQVGELVNDFYIYDPVATDVRIIRNSETNLGDLCADAVRYSTGADIGISNGGGIRVNLPAGPVTCRDLLNVHPFSNEICIVRCTGQTILDMLEISVSRVPEEFGGFLQVSGIEFEYDPTIPTTVTIDENEMVTGIGDTGRRVQSVLVNGESLDPEKEYTLAGNAYIILNLGNGYTCFEDCEIINPSFSIDFDNLLNYVRDVYPTCYEKYAEPYGEGRIRAIQ